MDFGEAVSEIVDLVKRPDKRTSIKGDVNRAIGFIAASGTFSHDLVELSHTVDGTLYAQSFAINLTPFVRFRKIKYMRATGQRGYIGWKDSTRVFDADGCETTNVFYRSGNNIVFKLRTLTPTLEIGYYQYHAPLVLDGDTDWMLDEMWPAVHDIATSYVMGSIGNESERARYFSMGMDMYRIFHRDLGDAVSYA